MSDKQPRKKIFDLALLKRVFRFAAPYKKKFYSSLSFSVILAILAPVRPYLIQLTINDYVKTGAGGSAVHQNYFNKILIAINNFVRGGTVSTESHRNFFIEMVITITIIQIILLLLESIVRFYFSYITAWLGQSVVKDMRVQVYNKILGLNLSQFDKTPIGTLTTRTINDIESINDIFSDGLIPIIADLLSIISVVIVMFVVDWKLSLICLAPFPVLIVATYFFKEAVNKSFIKVRNAVAALNAFVQEHITGMHVLQAFAAEEREETKFKRINGDHRNANIKAIFAYSVFFPVVEIVLAVSTSLLIWWAAGEAFALKNTDPVAAGGMIGKMISFFLFLNLLFRPLRVIADKFNVLQMGMIAGERVFKVLDNNDFIADNAKGQFAPARVNGKIEFDKVFFAYTDDRYVLKNISFSIKPGETVAIVGHTGSGKTSIISLLNRLYHIQKGSIKVDDVNIEQYNLDVLRSRIGIVLQDVFLFSGSVIDNITLRNPDLKREKVIEAATLIGMHDFIMELPGGYDYNVMERGATLSLGQRQLLSFIRALLYDPSILILDEATSSVDTESEQLIQHAIDTLIAGRTSIVIAHRLSTIRKANKIIVLDKGEIKEMGTHDELLKNNGFYARLYEMQFEKKRVAAL